MKKLPVCIVYARGVFISCFDFYWLLSESITFDTVTSNCFAEKDNTTVVELSVVVCKHKYKNR